MIHTIGRHRVKHGDITKGIHDLMQSERANIFYSDPPWGAGNLKYWQTMNNKMTGAMPQEVDYSEFLTSIFKTAVTYTDGPILIEYGIRWRNDIIQYGEGFGLKHHGIADLLYRSGSKLLPLDLHLFSKGNISIPENYFEKLRGTIGYETVRRAVLPFALENATILDPCCGMGYTASVAIESRMRFRGNELNSARLDKTIAKLQRDAK